MSAAAAAPVPVPVPAALEPRHDDVLETIVAFAALFSLFVGALLLLKLSPPMPPPPPPLASAALACS